MPADTGTVVLALLVTLAVWLVANIWPYTSCRRCSGGKHPSPSSKH